MTMSRVLTRRQDDNTDEEMVQVGYCYTYDAERHNQNQTSKSKMVSVI